MTLTQPQLASAAHAAMTASADLDRLLGTLADALPDRIPLGPGQAITNVPRHIADLREKLVSTNARIRDEAAAALRRLCEEGGIPTPQP